MPSAMKMARGTVRAGALTSPLGTSATSTPTNAKSSWRTLLPRASPRGQPGQANASGRKKKIPATMKIISGASLIRVIVSTVRAPIPTPRILIATRSSRIQKISRARPIGVPRIGINRPTEAAISVTIPEMASIAVRK